MDSFEFPTENSTLNSEYLEKICSGSECLPTVILLRDDHSVCIYIFFFILFFLLGENDSPSVFENVEKVQFERMKALNLILPLWILFLLKLFGWQTEDWVWFNADFVR